MRCHSRLVPAATAALTLMLPGAARADESTQLIELRNTVVNLLQALVERGVMTREQAESMVKQAQESAVAETQAAAAKADAEKDAVRVTYVPEIVRDQITQEVRDEVRPLVVDDVMTKARDERWGIPDALPEWTRRVSIEGDVRSRGGAAAFASDNAVNAYLDFQSINEAGGIGQAGTDALLNTSEDRESLQGRVRLRLRAQVTDNVQAFARVTSGNPRTPVSTNQTLGNYNGRWTATLDEAGIYWNSADAGSRQGVEFWAGRYENPFSQYAPADLVWDRDTTFEGVTARYMLDLGGSGGNAVEPNFYVTLGAFPIQEVELSSHDKWLYAAQVGGSMRIGESGRLHGSVAYYDYDNIVGRLNEPDSQLLDYTAPLFVQKGNTLFDIRNDLDGSTNLFALASDYDILHAQVSYDFPVGRRNAQVWGQYARNIGFDEDEILARTGQAVEARDEGYEAGFGVQSEMDWLRTGGWRAQVYYRYLQRDAVLDAFADSDFHLGGTDAEGWAVNLNYALAKRLWLGLRYLSANEIDGPPLGIDVLLLDLNATF
jgi:hypothetical protein